MLIVIGHQFACQPSFNRKQRNIAKTVFSVCALPHTMWLASGQYILSRAAPALVNEIRRATKGNFVLGNERLPVIVNLADGGKLSASLIA
jgi:hypothetical protein